MKSFVDSNIAHENYYYWSGICINTEETRGDEVSYDIILSADFGINVWAFHTHSSLGKSEDLRWTYFFFRQNLPFLNGNTSNFPLFVDAKECHPRQQPETKRGACTFTEQKSGRKGRAQLPTLCGVDAENHVAFFSSWKMVSKESRARTAAAK